MNWPKKLSAGLISLMMAVPSNAIGILAQEVEEEPIAEEEIVEVVEETTIEEAPVEIPEEEAVVEEEEPVEEITEEVPEETVEIVEEVPAEDEEIVEVVEEETEVVELEEGEPEPEGEPEIKATGTQHIYITGDDWGAGVDKTVIKLDKTIDPASVVKEDFAVTQAVNGGDATARTVTAAYTSDAEGNAVTTASEYITIEMRISPTEGNPIVWSMQTWTNSWADPFELNVNLAEGATIVSGEEEITALDITAALNVKDIDSADITVKQLDGYEFETYTTVN